MADTPFSSPASSDLVQWKELTGSLLMIEVQDYEEDIKTVHGESDAVRATVTVIDGSHAGDVARDTLIFPRVLQGQLRGKKGERVLGRLGTGNAKAGQSPPWQIADASEADVALAIKYLQHTSKAAAPAAAEDAPPWAK